MYTVMDFILEHVFVKMTYEWLYFCLLNKRCGNEGFASTLVAASFKMAKILGQPGCSFMSG